MAGSIELVECGRSLTEKSKSDADLFISRA